MFELSSDRDILDFINVTSTALIALFGLLINRNIQKNHLADQRDEVIGRVTSAVFQAISKGADLDEAIIAVQTNANKIRRLFNFKMAAKANWIADSLSELKRAKTDPSYEVSVDKILEKIKNHTAGLVLDASKQTGEFFYYSMSKNNFQTAEEVMESIFSAKPNDDDRDDIESK
jgi:hypothetical protein